MEKQNKYNLDRHKIFDKIKEYLLKYKIELKSETYGIEKINFDEIINVEIILDLILNDERKGIRLLPYIDLLNVSFKDQDITYIDFTNTNASLNPQTVKNKDFTHTILNGQDFKNCIWDNTRLSYTNFTGSTNVVIDPQKILYPSLYGCICNGVDFKWKSFKGVGLENTDLRGAKGVTINETEVWNGTIKTTKLDDNAIIIRKSEVQQIEEELDQAILKKILKYIPKCI